MYKQKLALSTTSLAITLALAACGGGGGGTSAASGGTVTTSQGIITGFGSVFVNGVEYATPSSTAINMNGTNATESDLQVGMLVTLKGTVNPDGTTGTAQSIEYADQMAGVVTATNVAADGTGTLTVMGQTITLTADTVFDSLVSGITSPDLIQVGNVVEVSGYAASGGNVTATRIEVKAATQAAVAMIEVKGIISSLDATAGTFTLGSLTVDYHALTAAELPTTALANGLYVEVMSTTPYDGTGPLIASRIMLEDDGLKGHDGMLGEDLEVKGLVTADFANDQFDVNGRTVLIDSSTRIVNGTTAQLVTGTPVKVHVHFDAQGQLVADKIDFKNASKVELEGTLQAIDLSAGTVTLLDQVIYVTSSTVILDKSDAAVRYFNLTDLNPANGDHLEVNAYLDSASGHLIATKLERHNYSANAKVTGTVDTSNGTTVAGVTIDTATATGVVPAITSGASVEVEGTYTSGVLHAQHVSLER